MGRGRTSCLFSKSLLFTVWAEKAEGCSHGNDHSELGQWSGKGLWVNFGSASNKQLLYFSAWFGLLQEVQNGQNILYNCYLQEEH